MHYKNVTNTTIDLVPVKAAQWVLVPEEYDTCEPELLEPPPCEGTDAATDSDAFWSRDTGRSVNSGSMGSSSLVTCV